MRTTRERLAEIKAHGYPFDFESTFNRTIAVYKRIALPGGIAFLLFIIVYFIVMSMTAASTVDMGRITPDMGFDQMMKEMQFQLENQTLQQKLIDAVSRIVMGVLAIPLMAGIMALCRAAETDTDADLGTVFQFYKGPHFSDLFIAALVINLITFTLGFSAQLVLPESSAAAFVLFVAMMVISVLTTLFVPLIIFGDLSPIEAITGSIAVVQKKFGTIFLLLLTSGILALLGLLACCIGIVFTLPLMIACQYAIYQQSVGIDAHTNLES